MTISKFAYTAATQTTQCPQCSAAPLQDCRAPNGHKCAAPHAKRLKAYKDSLTTAEYEKRHSLPK